MSPSDLCGATTAAVTVWGSIAALSRNIKGLKGLFKKFKWDIEKTIIALEVDWYLFYVLKKNVS